MYFWQIYKKSSQHLRKIGFKMNKKSLFTCILAK